MLRLSDFDYCLPKELIAQFPLKKRDQAKLMVLDIKHKTIEHKVFGEFSTYLSKKHLLVLNDTKVLPCRIFGKRKTGGKVELFLLGNKGKDLKFDCLIKPARVKIGEEIIFNRGSISCKITGRNQVYFKAEDLSSVYKLGVMPLPPYIKRQAGADDFEYYQTVYAQNLGALAAPTAGLHFTSKILQEVKTKGVDLAYITLHVGLGTFKPVKEEDITKHQMHKEYFNITPQAKLKIKQARKSGEKIIAVGTTSLRALESFAQKRKNGFTDIFIYPGYKFQATDSLLTNFHLPKSTLFMLVCAFAGTDFIKAAYNQAIEKKYRFYSYGDAMLII